MKRPEITAGKWSVTKVYQGFVEIRGDDDLVCDECFSPEDAKAIAAIPDMMDALEAMHVYITNSIHCLNSFGRILGVGESSGFKEAVSNMQKRKNKIQAAMEKAGYTFEE